MAKNELKVLRGLKFGVELEVKFSGDKTEIIEALKNRGIKVRQRWSGSIHTVLENAWKVVADGSVQGGWEIVSPPMSDMNDLRIVCEVLNELGCSVDKQCGLHVHHEASDLDLNSLKNVYEIYNKYELDVIHELLPVSRRNNAYCKPLTTVIEDVRKCNSIDEMKEHWNIGGGYGGHYDSCRYKSINFRAYRVYGTLEFRAHSGSIDFEKISNWILFTHKIIEVATEKKVIRPVTEKRKLKWQESVQHSSYDLYKELGIGGTELSKYLGSRRKTLRTN